MRQRSAIVAALLVMLSSALTGVGSSPARAQTEDKMKGALMLVMDASGSMKQTDDAGMPLIEGAKQALNDVVSALPSGAPVGLTVYGSKVSNTAPKQKGCRDTNVAVPVSPLDKSAMKSTIGGIRAKGYTPIGRSLRKAAKELPPEGPRTIILVSDGKDTCAPPPPCDVARDLKKQGIDVKIETVGFFLEGKQKARDQLKCIAEATGGSYHSADSADALAKELEELSSRAVRTYETKGQTVTGGASYQEAPTLEPGTYSDTILANEQLWYGVALAKGQELTVRSTLVNGGNGAEGVGFYEVQLVDPMLETMGVAGPAPGRVWKAGISDGTKQRTVNLGTRSGVVGPDKSDGDGGDAATRAGTYYIRLTTEGTGNSEYPVELAIDVTGASPKASSSPSISTSSASQATGSKSPAASGQAASSDRASSPMFKYLSGALALMVVGLIVALVMVLRKRPS